MKGPERPCYIKPQLRSLQNVLQRSVEPAARSGHSWAKGASGLVNDQERTEPYQLALAMFHNASGGDRKAQAKVIRYGSGVHSHRIRIPKGLQPRVSQFVRASM